MPVSVPTALVVVGVVLAGAAVLVASDFNQSKPVGLAILLTLGVTSVALALRESPVALVSLLFATTTIQRGLAAYVPESQALLFDDVVLIGVLVHTARNFAATISRRRGQLILLVAFVAVLVAATLSATTPDIATYQLRQILVPAVLLLFGSTLSRRALDQSSRFTVVIGILVICYASLEAFGFYPVDPNLYASALRESGASVSLPGFYYYNIDVSGADRIVRLGGHTLNPPVFGLVVAALALWATLPGKRLTLARAAYVLLLLLAAATTLGRGALLVAALVLCQRALTRYLGPFSAVLFFGVVALAVVPELLTHGQSASHVDGFLGGLEYSLANPLGGGFGVAGNALSAFGEQAVAGDESLAAIFFASCGWVAIIIVAVLLWRGIATGDTAYGVALTGAVTVALFSESAGGLEAASFLWLLGGVALNPSFSEIVRGEQPND